MGIVETLTALLGMYYGYKQIRPYETITFNDAKIDNIFGDNFNLKFKLDQKLDYILIESLYEFVFNNRKAGKDVLSFEPSIKIYSSIQKQIMNEKEFEFEFEKNVFGTSFYRIRILSDFDKISNLLIAFPEIILNHFHIVSFIRKYYDKTFYLLRGSSDVVFKSELLKLFEDDKINLTNIEHLLSCIELDKKFNLK